MIERSDPFRNFNLSNLTSSLTLVLLFQIVKIAHLPIFLRQLVFRACDFCNHFLQLLLRATLMGQNLLAPWCTIAMVDAEARRRFV